MENLLIILAIVIILFIVFRKFNLWYWKIQEMVNNQEKIIQLLTSINSNASSTEANSEEIAKALRQKSSSDIADTHWRDK